MEEKSQLQKQKELLTKIINEGHIIPELNLLTLNIKQVYLKEKYSDAEADRIVAQFNENKQYCNLINFLYDKEIRNIPIPIRNNNTEHNGTRSTMKTSKHGDIEVYFLEGFNYNELTADQKADLEEYLCFLDSIWEMRDEKVYNKYKFAKIEKSTNYEKNKVLINKITRYHTRTKKDNEKVINLKKENLQLEDKIKRYDAILKNKEKEDSEKKWNNLEEFNFNTIYLIDNILRHGIIDELGWIDEYKSDNILKLLDMRRDQLKKVSDCLKKLCNTNQIKEKDIEKTTQFINFYDKEYKKMTEILFPKIGTYITPHKKVINTCNNLLWSIPDSNNKIFTPDQINKIKNYSITYEELTSIKELSSLEKDKILTKDIDILYEFVDPFNEYIDGIIPPNKKQFIYGFKDNIDFYKNFNNYFNIKPWNNNTYSYLCNYEILIKYSILLNKLNVACIANTNILFPLRYIFNKPYNLNGISNINNKYLQQIQVSNSPLFLHKNTIIGYIKVRGTSINYIILKSNEDRRVRNLVKGDYNYFVMTNIRLEKMDYSNIVPTQNISWDEFNIMYNYLKKPIYLYNPERKPIIELLKKKEECNSTFTLFVHNNEYQPDIPLRLLNKLTKITPKNYKDLNMHVKYEDYIQNKLNLDKIREIFTIHMNGGNYYNKYLKYKLKYLKLKRLK